MRYAVEIESHWLMEIAPHYFDPEDLKEPEENKSRGSKINAISKLAEKHERKGKRRQKGYKK